MLTFTIRRLLLAIPTLLFISLVIFLLLELSPGDPLGDVPLTVPPEVKERMREALGLGHDGDGRPRQVGEDIHRHARQDIEAIGDEQRRRRDRGVASA